MNTQKMEKPVVGDGSEVDLHSIFYTIQGEGPFCGHSAIFVRLAGCNLQCPQCDTDYTKDRIIASIEEIAYVCSKISTFGLVVITGGEPFRQNIGPLVNLLIRSGYYVQVETNGTLPPSKDVFWSDRYWERNGAYIVCSPKTGKINPILEQSACAFKYVVSSQSQDKFDGLPINVLGLTSTVARVQKTRGRPIYIQPADSKDKNTNLKNTDVAIKAAKRFKYILQLQIHKFLNLE